jgi:hypothetical protein
VVAKSVHGEITIDDAILRPLGHPRGAELIKVASDAAPGCRGEIIVEIVTVSNDEAGYPAMRGKESRGADHLDEPRAPAFHTRRHQSQGRRVSKSMAPPDSGGG